VMLIFQPGEEKLPGGAKLMLEEGIFAEQVPDLIIAQHVLPELESGMVGFRPGKYMASCDEIFMTVKGKGGHGAMPHKITDTVLITSHIIVAMQQVVSRLADASIPSVLSFGKVIANGATNIIPPEVKVEGTFRTMNEQWRTSAHEHITRIAQLTAEAMGGQCDIRLDKGYPVLVNHEDYTRQIHQLANEYLGKEKTIDMDIRMTAEDFAYFTREYPCVYYRLGVKKPGQKEIHSLHSPTFDIDESALETGSGLMAWLAASFVEPVKKDNLV
jgi:amidohydrolase